MNKIMPTNWDGPKDTTKFIQIKLLRIIFISTASTCASCRFLSINQGGHYISQPKQCTLMAGDHPLSMDLNNFSRLSNGLDLDPLVVDKTPGALPQSLGLGGWWLNQPSWKICSSKWVHLPQFSGWRFKKSKKKTPPRNLGLETKEHEKTPSTEYFWFRSDEVFGDDSKPTVQPLGKR